MSRSLHAQPAPDFMIVVNRPVYVNYLHAVARTATFMVVGLVCLFATVALAQNEGKVTNGWLCSKAIPLGQPSTPSSHPLGVRIREVDVADCYRRERGF